MLRCDSFGSIKAFLIARFPEENLFCKIKIRFGHPVLPWDLGIIQTITPLINNFLSDG